MHVCTHTHRGSTCHQPLSTSSHHHQGWCVCISVRATCVCCYWQTGVKWRLMWCRAVDSAPAPPRLPSPWPSPPGPSSFLRIVVTHAKLEPSAATDGCNFNTATLRLNGFPSLLDFLLFFTAYLSSPFFRSLHTIGATATRSLAGSLLLPPHRHPRSTASRANRTCWSLRPDYCLDTHFVSPPLRHEHTRSQSPSSGYWYGGVTCKFTCHVTLATLQTTARARYGEWLTVPAPNGSQAISSLGAGL